MSADLGYWTVTLEPLPKQDRVSITKLKDRLGEAVVALRGWYFPHIPSRSEDLHPVTNGLEGRTDWDRYHERWRFFTTGLFVYRWRMREDGTERWKGTLRFVDAIWTMTELWEFARRLYALDSTVANLTVSVDIEGLSGRLIGSDPDAPVPQGRPLSADKFSRAITVPPVSLTAAASSYALDWAEHLFHERGLEGVPRSALKAWQDRLLARQFS